MHWKDTYRFLSKLTPLRLWNMMQLVGSFYISKWLKKPVHWGAPMTISFEPTTACNLRCPECPSGLRAFTRATGNLKQDFFRSSLDQVASRLVYLIFYFQGEPYINPDFLEMVRYAHGKGIYTITSTNGHFLNDENARRTVESGLDRIIISVDGTTQEVYEQYRKKGKLDHVLKGTENLINWKRKLKSATPHVIFQFLVVKPNEHQIPDLYDLADRMGVDEVKLKTAQIYDYKNGHSLIPDADEYSRYRKLPDGTYTIKNHLMNQCWKMWHACVITWDGIVVPCCFDKDAVHQLGNLKGESFREIWTGNGYLDFRRQILKGRENIDICRNCTEGCRVWA